MASEAAERRPGFHGICLLRALPVAYRFLSDDAAQPGGSGQRRINSQKEAEAEEEADEKRRRTRAAVEEPGAMPCMYRYRCRHRGC